MAKAGPPLDGSPGHCRAQCEVPCSGVPEHCYKGAPALPLHYNNTCHVFVYTRTETPSLLGPVPQQSDLLPTSCGCLEHCKKCVDTEGFVGLAPCIILSQLDDKERRKPFNPLPGL